MIRTTAPHSLHHGVEVSGVSHGVQHQRSLVQNFPLSAQRQLLLLHQGSVLLHRRPLPLQPQPLCLHGGSLSLYTRPVALHHFSLPLQRRPLPLHHLPLSLQASQGPIARLRAPLVLLHGVTESLLPIVWGGGGRRGRGGTGPVLGGGVRVRLIILSNGGEEEGAVGQATLHGFIHPVEPGPGGGTVCHALHPNWRKLQILKRQGGRDEAGGAKEQGLDQRKPNNLVSPLQIVPFLCHLEGGDFALQPELLQDGSEKNRMQNICLTMPSGSNKPTRHFSLLLPGSFGSISPPSEQGLVSSSELNHLPGVLIRHWQKQPDRKHVRQRSLITPEVGGAGTRMVRSLTFIGLVRRRGTLLPASVDVRDAAIGLRGVTAGDHAVQLRHAAPLCHHAVSVRRRRAEHSVLVAVPNRRDPGSFPC